MSFIDWLHHQGLRGVHLLPDSLKAGLELTAADLRLKPEPRGTYAWSLIIVPFHTRYYEASLTR